MTLADALLWLCIGCLSVLVAAALVCAALWLALSSRRGVLWAVLVALLHAAAIGSVVVWGA